MLVGFVAAIAVVLSTTSRQLDVAPGLAED
jgi:hypothetical protein